MESAGVQQHFTNISIRWSFNLENAPWWGGIFERMIQSVTGCLRKIRGATIKVKVILNSRLLSYVSSGEFDSISFAAGIQSTQLARGSDE